DEIEAIPTLDVRAKDGRAEVIDQDGRNRAMLAKENGVGLIPVAVHGLTGPVGWITDMRGQVRPFDFAAVPKVDKLAASRFPYDMPGVTYGNILPVARDTDTGKITLAAPEFIRSMARGMLDTGAQIVGDKPFQPQETPDQLSAASLGAGGPLVRSAEPAVNAAGQAVAGGAVRGANVLAEAMVPQSPEVGNFLRTLQGMTKNDNAAIDAINRRFAQDRAAGGPGIEEIGNQFAAARREGQPIVLADVAGENVRGLLGNVAREPGPARNRVKQFAVNRLGDIDRNSPIAASLEGGIERYLATGSARTEARALAEQRAAAAPLWEKAMSGGSIAPLGTFFEREFSDAGRIVAEANANIARLRQELTGLKARQSQAGNVYSTSGANRAVQFVQDKIADQEKKIAAADGYKTAVLEKLRQAQADQTANAPGAVWSPYLGRLLSNPRVKSGGLARGYRIERDLADAEGRQLNPREYAIVGEDANGDPIVGAVPNMKLLAVAKEGLDATLDTPAMRDELTGRLNKEGRAVKMLRDGLVNELDRLNPAYKTARDKWAGDSALIVAIRAGKEFHKTSPEEIAEWFGHASESEKEFYRLGAADTMRDDLQRKVFGADPSKAIINSPRMREQLRPMFRSDEDANRFLDRVRRARQMFQTPVDILGNSKTAAREAEDLARRHGLDTAADVLSGVAHAAAGHPIGIMRSGLNLARNYLSGPNLAVNDAVARLLLDPTIHVSPGENLLRSIPLPRTRNALAEGMRRGVQGFGQNRLLSGQ
ncbi:MAG TPA: hypothetical protein VFW56_11930, partial [Bradyrhizobium sp.]|nr:hypothetical protein [Bradyrhizobium sp.]